MIYTCSKCGYNTKQKSHFHKHINKVNPCSNEVVSYDKKSWEKANGKQGITELKSVEELNQLPREKLVEIIVALAELG